MALYMRNTQPSCDAASYTVKMLVPEKNKNTETFHEKMSLELPLIL